MDYVELTPAKLDVETVLSKVGSPDCGAISVFLGTTRNHFEGKQVSKLSYEAYAPMAKREMLHICGAVRQQWHVKNIALIHRLGEVPVGEASVLIAISSEHRQEAQEAVKYSIDEVKRRVPVWKKEHYEDGGQEWKENKECFWIERR
uniref:Molybdopterin synthase catalytic subunit n=1 Tax=Amblyomma maculatum TaxID=34609 RepID=G3MR74_AMBMU